MASDRPHNQDKVNWAFYFGKMKVKKGVTWGGPCLRKQRMSIESAGCACAACWTRISAQEKHRRRYSSHETAAERCCGCSVATVLHTSKLQQEWQWKKRSKGASRHSLSDLRNVTAWKQTIIRRTERDEKQLWFEMRVQSEGMREDIEGERGKKSTVRGMQQSHWWPSGNTQLRSGNMTVADAPDGRSGKSVKNKKGTINVAIGFEAWKKPAYACFISLSSPLTPRPSYSPTRPITSPCPVCGGLLSGITLRGETPWCTEKEKHQ